MVSKSKDSSIDKRNQGREKRQMDALREFLPYSRFIKLPK
jgi:hypothetical protein